MNNVPKHIQYFIDSKIIALAIAVDEVLNEWQGEGCLQIPTLLGSLAVKLNWNDEQVRQNDPVIRLYIKSHPDFCIARGAKGGVMRMSDKDKKEALFAAKQQAKEEALAAVNAKLALKQSNSSADQSDILIKDNSNNIDSDKDLN